MTVSSFSSCLTHKHNITVELNGVSCTPLIASLQLLCKQIGLENKLTWCKGVSSFLFISRDRISGFFFFFWCSEGVGYEEAVNMVGSNFIPFTSSPQLKQMENTEVSLQVNHAGVPSRIQVWFKCDHKIALTVCCTSTPLLFNLIFFFFLFPRKCYRCHSGYNWEWQQKAYLQYYLHIYWTHILLVGKKNDPVSYVRHDTDLFFA